MLKQHVHRSLLYSVASAEIQGPLLLMWMANFTPISLIALSGL